MAGRGMLPSPVREPSLCWGLGYCSLLLWEGLTLHWGSKAHLGFVTAQTGQGLSSPDGKMGRESWEPAGG